MASCQRVRLAGLAALVRHARCTRSATMGNTGEPRELPAADNSSVLRDQEAEFYEAVLLLVSRIRQ